LFRKDIEVLKERQTEWSADRSAAADCKRWKDVCKPSGLWVGEVRPIEENISLLRRTA